MGKREENRASNELFVQRILENKEVLFGKHSNKITQQQKSQIWENIRLELINAGAVAFAGKSAAELSVKFSDMKRRTMNKMENGGKTGTGGQVLTNVDNLILDIVGRDSAEIKGLSVADSENPPTPFETGKSSKLERETAAADEDEEFNFLDDDLDVQNSESGDSQLQAHANLAEMLGNRGMQLPENSQLQPSSSQFTQGSNVQMKVQKKDQKSTKRSGGVAATDLDIRIKEAKLAYYVAQKELAYQQKAESAERTDLLHLEVEEKTLQLQKVRGQMQPNFQVQLQDQRQSHNVMGSQNPFRDYRIIK